MTDLQPRSAQRVLCFENGTALGFSHRWDGGQYCSIITPKGIVGCGIYDLRTAGEFGQSLAIAKGTPAHPLAEPEDLYEAKLTAVTPAAEALGIQVGMTGKAAVELMLKASQGQPGAAGVTPSALQVKNIDHVTLVVADLERTRKFYVDLLGMQVVNRPGFNFAGSWFQIGHQQIHLIEAHAESAPAGFPAPPEYVSPGRTFHFAFEVDDARPVVQILQAHGVEVKGEPRNRPDGCLQVFCYDPDGHVVEIFSRPRTGACS